jgi:flagellar basal body P-ring formation protein FlgA
MKQTIKTLAVLAWLLFGGELASLAATNPPPAFALLPGSAVDSQGVFLEQVVATNSFSAPPQVRLCAPPLFGQALVLTRAQVMAHLQQAAPEVFSTNWTGAERIRITRRARLLLEPEIKQQITALLQRDFVRDKGDLELRLTRPWAPVAIPQEPYSLKILDVPTAGVTPNFITRFEISAGSETVGAWQLAAQAKVWREVWVARAALRGGQVFTEADVTRERRDVLGIRETPFSGVPSDATLELAEMVPAGAPICVRSLRLRPVIHRGQVADALLQAGSMVISLKVEVLENGAPGQLVRIRNLQSKREFRGKVQNEQTVLVVM